MSEATKSRGGRWRKGEPAIQPARAILFGVLGAAAISVVSGFGRALGVHVSIEMVLGTLTGMAPGGAAFGIGLLMHLAMGGLFGLLYGYLFERVWVHGGVLTGLLLAGLHALVIGSLLGFVSEFHPAIPEQLADPGPYFSRQGTLGVALFFLGHLVYGAIVGGGYGHVIAEKEWAPSGRS